jgi:hypothetical protein
MGKGFVFHFDGETPETAEREWRKKLAMLDKKMAAKATLSQTLQELPGLQDYGPAGSISQVQSGIG